MARVWAKGEVLGENWFLVRQLRNPVRGDSGQVSVMCRRYSSLADTFESMASQLSADSGGVQQGKWAEALRRRLVSCRLISVSLLKVSARWWMRLMIGGDG